MSVCMFVYLDFASVAKSSSPGGSVPRESKMISN